MQEISNRLEPLWDSFLVNEEASTTSKVYHELYDHGPIDFAFDKPWDCNLIQSKLIMTTDDGTLRFYYTAINGAKAGPVANRNFFCCLESRDGIHWTRPNIGLVEFDGSCDNNILIDSGNNFNVQADDGFPSPVDEFNFMFIDPNPNCPPDERWKALFPRFGQVDDNGYEPRYLHCYVSADGLHWRFSHRISDNGGFDSQNTAHYLPDRQEYVLFYRSVHTYDNEDYRKINYFDGKDRTRDIRVCFSKDFRNWTEPRQINFGPNVPDFPLYTNGIAPYYRAPHILAGLPTRYTERHAFSESFTQLPCWEQRQKAAERELRGGTAITDTLFMCSRDALNWERSNTAVIRPGPENECNWAYGDGYPALGMFEVPAKNPGAAPLTALLVTHNASWVPHAQAPHLYTIRRDGFVSRSAGEEECVLITKPFILRTDKLYLNFSTSARGYIRVEVLDHNGYPFTGLCTDEIFGDSTDREIRFPGNLQDIADKVVQIRMRMREADVYAIRFGEEYNKFIDIEKIKTM